MHHCIKVEEFTRCQGVHGAMAKAIGWGGLPPRVQILGAALYSGFILGFSGASLQDQHNVFAKVSAPA